MKQLVVVVLLVVAVFFHQTQAQCNATNCVGPACKCMNTSPPGNLALKDTPQLVFLVFDGAITTSNYDNYTYLLNNRINPNGCPIGMTFFVFHEYNDYTLTNSLYHKRCEIATHSMSHQLPNKYWADLSSTEWVKEIGGIKDALSKFANIPSASIRGARAPYYQSSGDRTFEAMKSLNMFYDSSFSTTRYTNPPIWPYTLDQGFQHDCSVPPCPTGKFPGIWTVPLVSLNRNGTVCSNAETCQSPTSELETLNFLKSNFERHYNTSKAPFGVHLTANTWFTSGPYRLEGYRRFLDYLATKDDVYVVPINKGLDWMKNPKPLSEVSDFFDCNTALPSTQCKPVSCFYEGEASVVGERNMKSCVSCPAVYPWTGNPLGNP